MMIRSARPDQTCSWVSLGWFGAWLAGLCWLGAIPSWAAEVPSFWNPAREAAAALKTLQSRNVSPHWRPWWNHLEGDRLLAMARGEIPVDRALLVAASHRLEQTAARREPEFYALHEALLDWRVELELIRSGPLAPLVRRAADHFQPTTPEEVVALVRATRLAAARTSASLMGPYANGWREYLLLPTLVGLPETPPSATRATLSDVYRRTSAGYVGLDRRGIVSLRSAVGRLLDGLDSLHEPDPQGVHRRNMLALAAALETLDQGPDPGAARTVSSSLVWLERSDRRRPFAYAVRRRYTGPNVYVDVSADFVRAASAVPFVRTEPVRDQIQDISIRGTRTARGQVWLELVPHPTRLSFDISMRGDFVARTIGWVQRARIYGDTTAVFSARKRVTFDGLEVQQLPSTAAIRQRSHIRGIAVDVIRLFRRFATRRAWREALARRATVEGISRQHSHDNVRREFDRELRREIDRLSQLYRQTVWAPLMRYDEFPRLTKVATTSRAIQIRALLTDLDTVGALIPPPPPTAGTAVTIRVHESALSYAARRLSERNWPDGEIDEVLRELLEPAAAPPPAQGATVFVFTDDHPLSVRFAGDEVHIALRLDEGSIDGRAYRDLRVTAAYDVSNLADRAQLIRRGPLEIEPVEVHSNGEKMPELETVVRELLQAHLERALPPVASPQPPAWWRRGRVTLRRVAADQGWLALTWDDAPDSSDRKTGY